MRPLALLLLAASGLLAAPPLYEPALSPDHREIAFVSGGDLWTVPAEGGEARLLVSHPATESRPLYSPDGTQLAFVSTRTGAGDIYVLDLRTGELKRITFDDTRAALDAWSPDGKYLYFSSNRADIASVSDIYRVPAAGGTPFAIAADRYVDESQAAPNPHDPTFAFVSGNMAVTQWWRNGHAHIDETRIAIVTPAASRDAAPQYKTLLENQAKNLWPMWSADGKSVFYMSDKSGSENIWRIVPGSHPVQITRFTAGRVLWPVISRDGKAIVFERDFRIWKLDTASGATAPVDIALRGVPAGPSTTHLTLTSDFRDLALSPDGKKVAVVAHGEIFAASAKDGGNAVRLTSTPGSEEDLRWAPDSKKLLYVSDRGGVKHLYVYDLARETETALSDGPLRDEKPVWSPDGKQIAYIRDGRELHVLKPDVKEDRVLTTHKYRALSDRSEPVSWSPDGQWLAYFTDDSRGFSNVAVVPAAGGPETPISYLANGFANRIVWSPDRTYLLFNTGQRTEQRSICRIDLIPRTPKYREDQFRDLFHEPNPRNLPQPEPVSSANPPSAPAGTPAALVTPDAKPSKPVQITFEGIRRRLSVLPLSLDTSSPVISPDGKLLLFAATAAGQQNLYTYSLDELAKEPAVPRQLTSTAGPKSRAQFSPDGKEIFYLDSGRISVMPVDTRIPRPLAVTAELDTDFAQEKAEVFHQAWTILNETYYDPKFHGANWSDVRGQYAPMVAASRTPDEVRRVISLMIGDLNSSHSGIAAGPGGGHPPATGRLGIVFDPSDNTILSVTPLGPAAVAGIKAGEKLLAIDGKPIGSSTNIDELLQYKIGKRTVLTTSVAKEVAVLPVNTATEKKLLYLQLVDERRAYVNKISNGRLGYVHMLDMSDTALNQLYLDLDAENQSRAGVVIDIRNNNGGFVNAYALDVFTRRPYLTMTPRDRAPAPARSTLGQRSLELPTVLVVNRNSLSDAEDFTEGYRALKLGKVVGEPTAGWIIYTSSAELIDGSSLRTPTTRITANDGTDMELHPRPVDIEVPRPLGESYAGRDTQLDAAVKTLLAALP